MMSSSKEKSDSIYSFDSWGLTNPDCIETYRERTKKWKPYLLEAAKHVRDILKTLTNIETTQYKPVWFLTDGTLLGAYRNGQMISHDYDFDFGICFVHEKDGTIAGLDDCKREIDRVGQHVSSAINKKYTVKTNATDYAYKIEVHDESTGGITEDGPSKEWSNVNLDIQGYYSHDQKKLTVAYFRGGLDKVVDINVSDVLPLSEIQFELLTFPSPKNPKSVLTGIYGYIGTPAKFNKLTQKYEPAD